MSYSTKGVPTNEGGKSAGISYGILKLKLMDFSFKNSQTGKKMLEFYVEDDTPVGEDGFEYEGVFGKRKATNKSGRVAASIYIDVDNDNEHTNQIVASLAVLAEKVGCREELDKVEGNNFEEYLKAALKVVGGKYAYFVIKAEEYINQTTGKPGITRSFKYWKDAPMMIFSATSTLAVDGKVQTLTTPEGKTITWDKNNVYDYKPAVKPDVEVPPPGIEGAPPINTLPF